MVDNFMSNLIGFHTTVLKFTNIGSLPTCNYKVMISDIE